MSTALDVDTSVLEALDFAITPPCEHPEHPIPYGWHDPNAGAAMFIRRLACPECGNIPGPSVIGLCQRAWDFAAVGVLFCTNCRHVGPREEFWRYLGPVTP